MKIPSTKKYAQFAAALSIMCALVFGVATPRTEASFFDSADGSRGAAQGTNLPASQDFFGQPVQGNQPSSNSGSFFGSASGGSPNQNPSPNTPTSQQGSFFPTGGGFFGGSQQSQPQPGPTPVNTNIKIVAYGDSIVRGAGANPGTDFVSLLSARTGVQIINAGVSGATTQSALQNLDQAVLSHDPDIVILFIGGNDILGRLSPTAMFSNIREMVERIQASGAKVILLGVHDAVFRIDYETSYRNIALQTNAYYVPGVLEDIVGRVVLTTDFIHPNTAGHRIIADRVEPTLRLAIEDTTPTPGPGSLSVTCSANPSQVRVGELVTWTADVGGSTGPTAYSWSGDENLLANSQTARAIYRMPGVKSSVVHVSSGNRAASAQCSTTVLPQLCASANISFWSRFFGSGGSQSCE